MRAVSKAMCSAFPQASSLVAYRYGASSDMFFAIARSQRSPFARRLELSSKMSGTGAVGARDDMNALSICPTDSGAKRRCALGALIAAAYQITNDLSRAHDLAISAVRPLYGSATLVNVNDVRGHAAVLALLDEVLAAM